MDLEMIKKYLKRIRIALKLKKAAGRTKQIGTFAFTHKRETKYIIDSIGKLLKKGVEYGQNKGIPGFKTK